MKNAIKILVMLFIITIIGGSKAQSLAKVYVTYSGNTYSIHLVSDAVTSGTLSAFSLAVRYPNTCTISPGITFAGLSFVDNFSADLYAGVAPGYPSCKIQGYQYSTGSSTLNLTVGSDNIIGTFTVTGGTSGTVDLVHEFGGAGVAVIYIEYNTATDVTAYPDPLAPNTPISAATAVSETPNANTWYYLRYSSAPLPVELTSLTASASRLNAQISWTTATETNNYGFEVERRSIETSGAAWAKVGFVQGVGTSSSPKDYSYVDASASAGRYAYRLKQIDNDGAFKYSQSTELEVGYAAKELALCDNYPNPFNPTTNVEFTVANNGRAVLKVYNAIGQEVAELFNGEAQAGKIIQARFDASRLASGIYYSRLQADGKSLVKRMMFIK